MSVEASDSKCIHLVVQIFKGICGAFAMVKGIELAIKDGWKDLTLEEADSYAFSAQQLIRKCDSVVFEWIPRGINEVVHHAC
ncbi:hypothetical protein PanWU01x14_307210 [Parasponia andersonii]|uniref:Uncharacterized protein n=1 Tax=Parasponia andersonii TaxID=3476 RepID=A0A2P5ARQ3_PARAD|nr:hypothetical protein PanWU01x14_307210 [Parasponia andersonii]